MLNLGSLQAFQQTITTSGTPVQGTSFDVPDGVEIILKSREDNSGIVTVGSTSARADNTTSTNIRLTPNQSVSYSINNPNLLFFDSTSSGDIVEITFEY